MSRVCLDTSAYSHYKRGDAAAVEVISTAPWIGISAIVLGELQTGFLLSGRPGRNAEELRRFLRHPLVQVLDVDDETSRIYAEMVVGLRQAGTPLPTNDIWIAAAAAREGATLITYDKHFQMIHRVGARILSGD